METRKIRTMIADDHVLIREGLKEVLKLAEDIDVVAEAGQLADIPTIIRESNNVDVLLLDLSFPEGNALEIIPNLKQLFPDKPRILVLTVYPSTQYAPQCFAAGAHGFLQKDSSMEELLRAIRRVHTGHIYDEEGWLNQNKKQPTKKSVNRRSLSRREQEVLIHLAQGRSTVEISKFLGLSPNTIKTYRSRLLEKLGFRNEADLIRYALTNNLFT
ncbi:response regulator transcription factor [bacterium]|nr:response regulator transcription factor [bacterium]